ncbi:MAG: C4-type zinc ribbon domain-containing protein [Clostridiaceae bacterium]|nr:C4-type zinc ribbon domain-containing protein [Eubacteriales bacterium]
MNKLEALLRYHEAELALDRLESRVKTSPERQKLNKLYGFLSEQQTQINGIRAQLELRNANVTKLASHFEELQKQYELELSEIAIMENDEQCTAAEMAESRRALEALLEQITAERRDLYDTLSWIENATNDYKETYARAGKAKKEYDELRAQCDDLLKAAQPEIDAAKAVVDSAKKDVDEELLKKYTFVKSHHAVPIAKVENNQCSGCNMSLPTAVVKRVSSGLELVECENCGRILYT